MKKGKKESEGWRRERKEEEGKEGGEGGKEKKRGFYICDCKLYTVEPYGLYKQGKHTTVTTVSNVYTCVPYSKLHVCASL